MIRCNQHDYLEIACLYGYRLRLTLRNHQVIEGNAKDIVTIEHREFLIIENDGRRLDIDVEQLKSLHVLTPAARFGEIVFQAENTSPKSD